MHNPVSSTRPVRKMPLWFKFSVCAALLALCAITWGILFTEKLVDVVEKQLLALRQKEIEKAYSYTSIEFQKTVSLDQFRRFIQAYPIFQQSQSAHFATRTLQDQVAILRGKLTSPDLVRTSVEYQLVKEKKKWRILSMQLLQPGIGPGFEEEREEESLAPPPPVPACVPAPLPENPLSAD